MDSKPSASPGGKRTGGNNGDGTLQAARLFAVGESPRSIVATDLDADGRLDLLTANPDANEVMVLCVHCAQAVMGRLRLHEHLAVGSRPWFLAAADFNDDGRLDIALANADSNDISVLTAKGGAAFEVERRLVVVQKFPVTQPPTHCGLRRRPTRRGAEAGRTGRVDRGQI